MSRDQKLATIRRWMKYMSISMDDIGIRTQLEKLSDLWLLHILQLAEEDRARLVADGCFIREDWTEAT